MRTILAFDTETYPIAPGLRAPRMVCLQWAAWVPTEGPAGSGRIEGPHVLLREPGLAWARWALGEACAGRALLVGHGVPFDLGVLAALDASLLVPIFYALEHDVITDTELRQKLADIGRGMYRTRQYNLGAVGARHGYHVDKDNPWRVRYGELDGISPEQWPEDARRYALDDPAATLHAYLVQEGKYRAVAGGSGAGPYGTGPYDLLCDEFNQTRKFFALDLTSAWGLRTSERGVLSLETGTRQHLDELEEWLQEEGLVKPDGVRDTKRAKARMVQVHAEAGTEPRRTPPSTRFPEGDICLDSDACNECDDPVLEAYSEYSSLKKVLTNDVKWLRTGLSYPVQTNYDLAMSGRVTSSKPNVQNPRRLPGVRECYVPRN